MFTGLVQALGTVAAIDGGRLRVEAEPLGLSEGDSIAVNGVCLTATGVEDGAFEADVMGETLRRSTLGSLARGDAVNLGAAAARRRPARRPRRAGPRGRHRHG